MLSLEVTLGNLLTIVAIIGTAFVFVLYMRRDLDLHEQRLAILERETGKISNALTEIARHQDRFTDIDRRLTDHRVDIGEIWKSVNKLKIAIGPGN